MPFLDPTEMSTHIYAESVGAITNNDATIMPQAIAAAVNEAMGYLSRFDTTTLFSQTGADRDPLLLLNLKNMALWHFITLGNANVNYEIASDRYKQAIRWLEKIESSKVVPPGWALAPDPDDLQLDSEFKVSSRPKRCNDY